MEQNSKVTQKNSVKLVVAVMGMGLSFILDVYAMINLPENYIVLGIVSVIFLVFTFLLVQSVVKLHMIKIARQEEVYSELFKSSKATYLMMRKSFGEMEDTVNNIGELVKTPIAEFMDEQKNISQITVNRSKENADALMNSNDKLLDKFFEFETTLENFEEQMISKQKELMDNSVREITMKQQELSTVIKDSEFEIKKEMLSMSRPMVQQAAQPMPEQTYASVSAEVNEEISEVINVEEEVIPEVIMDENPIEEEITLDEVTSMDILPEIDDLLSMEEEPLPMPDLSDPNKMMSPDDIAALIASMGVGNNDAVPVEETMPEELVVEEPVEEEVAEEDADETQKPPMPDLSDPNKMMTPEDIAALLANL